MIRQYNPQRFRYHGHRHVGTIPVGTLIYIQDNVRPLRGVQTPTIHREPWEVLAWLNREYFSSIPGGPAVKYMAGGHLALVRSLRNGRLKRVADWLLLACMDADLEKAA